MRLALRFILPFFVMCGLITYGLPLVDSLTSKWFTRNLDIRAKLIANTMQDALIELENRSQRVQQLLNRAIQDERLSAIGFCNKNNILIHKSETPRIGQLALVRDLNFLERHGSYIKKYILDLFVGFLIMISLITVLSAQLSFRGWMLLDASIIRQRTRFLDLDRNRKPYNETGLTL